MNNLLKIEKTVLTPLSEDSLRETSAGSCSVQANWSSVFEHAWDDFMAGFSDGANCSCRE